MTDFAPLIFQIPNNQIRFTETPDKKEVVTAGTPLVVRRAGQGQTAKELICKSNENAVHADGVISSIVSDDAMSSVSRQTRTQEEVEESISLPNLTRPPKKAKTNKPIALFELITNKLGFAKDLMDPEL